MTSSYDEDCPVCGGTMSAWYDSQDGHGAECLNCGFWSEEIRHQLTLKELNERRADNDLSALKELPAMLNT